MWGYIILIGIIAYLYFRQPVQKAQPVETCQVCVIRAQEVDSVHHRWEKYHQLECQKLQQHFADKLRDAGIKHQKEREQDWASVAVTECRLGIMQKELEKSRLECFHLQRIMHSRPPTPPKPPTPRLSPEQIAEYTDEIAMLKMQIEEWQTQATQLSMQNREQTLLLEEKCNEIQRWQETAESMEEKCKKQKQEFEILLLQEKETFAEKLETFQQLKPITVQKERPVYPTHYTKDINHLKRWCVQLTEMIPEHIRLMYDIVYLLRLTSYPDNGEPQVGYKIGESGRCVIQRIAELDDEYRANRNIKIVGVARGNRRLEECLHKEFASSRQPITITGKRSKRAREKREFYFQNQTILKHFYDLCQRSGSNGWFNPDYLYLVEL